MEHTNGFNRARINPAHDGELAFWARLLDASPEEIRGAIEHIGPDVSAVRTFLAERQLRLDFGPKPAELAAIRAASH